MTETSTRSRAMTATKARVRRAWRLLGRILRMRRSHAKRRSTSGSPLREGVTDATDGQDEGRRRRVVLDLLAQVADVHVDRLLVLVERLVVAQQLQQLGTGVDAARSRCQVAQDLELGRGQADPPGPALDAPPFQVDDEVAMAEHATPSGIGQIAVGTPEQRLDPAEQLAQAVRLGQVVVSTELEADHLVDLIVAGRQDQDRHLGARRTDPTQDLEPVDAWQTD